MLYNNAGVHQRLHIHGPHTNCQCAERRRSPLCSGSIRCRYWHSCRRHCLVHTIPCPTRVEGGERVCRGSDGRGFPWDQNDGSTLGQCCSVQRESCELSTCIGWLVLCLAFTSVFNKSNLALGVFGGHPSFLNLGLCAMVHTGWGLLLPCSCRLLKFSRIACTTLVYYKTYLEV